MSPAVSQYIHYIAFYEYYWEIARPLQVHQAFIVCITFPDPPGPPEIKGYNEGETIRMGQTVSLTCLSYGGNPPATITWFRNGEMVDMSYTTSGRESRNLYTFVAASEDNKAKYSCEARNEMSREAMNADITLSVQCK